MDGTSKVSTGYSWGVAEQSLTGWAYWKLPRGAYKVNLQYAYNGKQELLVLKDNKFQLYLSYLEINEFVDRDYLKMNHDVDFSYLEEQTWQDIPGFGRQMLLNGNAFDKLLPPSERRQAIYLSLFFYSFVMNVDKDTQYVTLRIMYRKTGRDWKEVTGSRASTTGNTEKRGISG